MSAARKKRRADGTLRPTVVRRRQRLRREERARAKAAAGVSGVQDPRAELKFKAVAAPGTVIGNSVQLRQLLNLDLGGLGRLMDRCASAAKWAKLRDLDGTVRAIGMPRNHPDLAEVSRSGHRAAMVAVLEQTADGDVA